MDPVLFCVERRSQNYRFVMREACCRSHQQTATTFQRQIAEQIQRFPRRLPNVSQESSISLLCFRLPTRSYGIPKAFISELFLENIHNECELSFVVRRVELPLLKCSIGKLGNFESSQMFSFLSFLTSARRQSDDRLHFGNAQAEKNPRWFELGPLESNFHLGTSNIIRFKAFSNIFQHGLQLERIPVCQTWAPGTIKRLTQCFQCSKNGS